MLPPRLLPFLRRLLRLAFWSAVALVAWGQLSTADKGGIEDFGDKYLHFTAYFGLMGIAYLAFHRRVHGALLAVALLAMGGAMEGLQYLVGRDAEWGDMAANTIGVFVGLALAVFVRRLAGPLVDGKEPD